MVQKMEDAVDNWTYFTHFKYPDEAEQIRLDEISAWKRDGQNWQRIVHEHIRFWEYRVNQHKKQVDGRKHFGKWQPRWRLLGL